ncbi:hypothetical protein [Haloarchaeobius sp. TZWSO28]|uniref:hypothetical protein n=1 Tax=Haloarchaeobius sp. TZWSO28 TaxID=3446119 RepID=UPI003EB98C67
MNERPHSTSAVDRLCATVAADPNASAVGETFDLVSEAGIADRYRLAKALDRIVAVDPSAVDEILDRVEPLIRSERSDDRRFATIVLEQVAGRAPARAASIVDHHLSDVVADDDLFVRRHAVWALAHVSDHDPAGVAPLVPKLEPGPERPPFFEYEHILLIARNVGQVDPDAIVGLVPSLFEVLSVADSFVGNDGMDEEPEGGDPLLWLDEFKTAIEPGMTAASVLAELSAARPDAITEYVADAADVLQTVSRVTVRRDVVEALSSLATDHPAAVQPAIGALAAQLESRDDVLQARAARALGLAYDAAPEAVAASVVDSLSSLEPLLRNSDPAVRVAVASLYSCVAETDPDAVAPFEDALIASLDTDQETVLASVAMTLGLLGTDDAIDAIEELLSRELDPSLEVAIRHALDGADP